MVDHFQDVEWQLGDEIKNGLALACGAGKISKSISGCSRYGSDSSYPKDRSSRLWVVSTVLDGSLLFARGAMSRDRAGWMDCVSSYCNHLLSD